jgi:hypothetical protein
VIADCPDLTLAELEDGAREALALLEDLRVPRVLLEKGEASR